MTVNTSTSPNLAANVVAYGSTAKPRNLNQSLDSDDFMRLLAVQFQHQDPMKPMEDTAFIAQMAQFTALEQSNSLVKEMGLLRSEQQNLAATGMLGRKVTVTDENGGFVTGEVRAMESSSRGPVLVIDGVKYPLSAVQRVEFIPSTNPSNLSDLPPAA